jgi:hypothetical protein
MSRYYSYRLTGFQFLASCVFSLCALCALGGEFLHAQTSYPMVMCVRPVAVQVGQTTECEVLARYNLSGAYKVFVTGDGVTATVMDEPKPAKPNASRRQVSTLKVRFQAAADALAGVRDVRIATPQGASTLGQIVVVRDPIVREAANNDTLQTAQPVSLPATVCGAIEKREDVDFYKFKVAAGTALTFHVRCQRLENRIHDLQEHADPIISLRNAAGSVLASNDNYFFGDPLLHYRFPTAGEFYLEIRDTRYGGNPYWQYCIEINDRPFVTCVHPLRLNPGRATRLRLIGYNLPAEPFTSLRLPPDTPDGPLWTTLPLGSDKSNVVPLVVSRLPGPKSEEWGVRSEEKKVIPSLPTPHSSLLTAPCGISSCIPSEDEADRYSFEAKAGERFTIAVSARPYQSALDSLVRIVNDKGRVLIENDDARDRYVHADSRIENWSAPASGRYTIEVRDLHGRGGENFVYFLTIVRSEPYFELEIDSDKTLLAPGLASTIFVRAVRKNGFAGEIQLGVEGLPTGVTAHCGRILADGRDGCILVRAAPDAKQAAVNLRIFGTTPRPDGKGKLEATARPLQEIYMPGGGRYHYPADMHTLSIGDPLDIQSVTISPASVTLQPGESKRVEVAIQRRPGFKGNVTLDTVYQHLNTIYGSSMPPGVRIDDKASQTLLTGEQTKAYLTFRAATDAKPVEKQLVPIMAHVSINFVMKWTFCGEPFFITVAKPGAK